MRPHFGNANPKPQSLAPSCKSQSSLIVSINLHSSPMWQMLLFFLHCRQERRVSHFAEIYLSQEFTGSNPHTHQFLGPKLYSLQKASPTTLHSVTDLWLFPKTRTAVRRPLKSDLHSNPHSATCQCVALGKALGSLGPLNKYLLQRL